MSEQSIVTDGGDCYIIDMHNKVYYQRKQLDTASANPLNDAEQCISRLCKFILSNKVGASETET